MKLRARIAAALLGTLAAAAYAEQYVDAGEYCVHYSAINTTQLAPDVARRFGVARTRGQALLVLNAQRRDDGGRYRPVAATASGAARSLIGQVETLDLRALREGDVHYVVAPFDVLDGEFLTIDAQILPAGANAPIALKFQQQFYRE